MEVDEFLAQIELEQQWREAELRFLANHLNSLKAEAERETFRRSYILMLYAHFEGFVKFALQHYMAAINAQNIRIGDASHCIAAASLGDLFKSLRNPEKKSDYFRRSLPNDVALHRYQRDRDFIESMEAVFERPLKIPDDTVDFDSNLKPEVLQKNLFRLGLPYKDIEKVEGKITALLRFRNAIAHGEFKSGLQQAPFQKCLDGVEKAQRHVKSAVLRAYQSKAFLKANSPY